MNFSINGYFLPGSEVRSSFMSLVGPVMSISRPDVSKSAYFLGISHLIVDELTSSLLVTTTLCFPTIKPSFWPNVLTVNAPPGPNIANAGREPSFSIPTAPVSRGLPSKKTWPDTATRWANYPRTRLLPELTTIKSALKKYRNGMNVSCLNPI